VVAIGAAVVQMQVATIAGTFGVYFAHITTTTTLPAYLVSAVPSVMGFIMFAFCPVSTALAKQYGTRPVALTGAVIATVSVAASAIVDNFYWFFIFFSVFGGIGSGLILIQGNVTVQKYFVTKRGTANGIFMSGGALGNMLMPIVLRYSINYMGFRLTLLLHAACISLTIGSALTFKPINVAKCGLGNEALKKTEDYEENEGGNYDVEEKEKSLQEKTTGLFCGPIWLPQISQIFIWKVLKNPLFLLLTFSVITSRTSLRGMGTLLPAFGESIGLDKETSVYLVSIMSVADFGGRIFSPLATDFFFPKVAKKNFFIGSTFLMFLSLFVLGLFVNSLLSAILCCVLFGFGISGVAAFMNVIFAESMGIETIQDTIGLMYLFTGIWMLPTLPIIGLLRDLSGNFQNSFLGLAASTLAGTLVWIAEPKLRRFGRTEQD